MQEFQKLKSEGNNQFKEKNYTKAKETFLQVVKNIEESNEDYDSHVSECGKLYVNVLTNVALCCLSIKTEEEYLVAIEVCDKALKIEKNNQKALYRRGLAYKQYGESREKEDKLEGVYENYEKAKSDLEKVCLLDRSNKLAEEKLNQTFKNIARLKVTNQIKKTEEKKEIKKISTAKQQKGESKISMKMQTIMKNYKVDEVVKIAQEKAEQTVLNNPLPQSKTDLEKSLKQLSKKPELLKTFFLKFKEGYLQKMDPGFDLLFIVVNCFVTIKFEDGVLEEFGKVLQEIVKAKAFKFVWKGLIESERKDIREKIEPILKVRGDLRTSFQ